MNRYVCFLSACWLVLGAAFAAADEGRDAKADIDPQALKELQAMGTFLSDLKQFSVEAEEAVDDFLDETGQKIQLTNYRKILVSRPNRVRGEVRGDNSNRLFVYNGETVTVLERDPNIYMQFSISGSIPTMLDELHKRFQFTVPLADLLFPRPDQILLERAETGRYLGLHYAGGVQCHHLAFTQRLLDWQIWIEAGEKPWPRKLVITHHRQAGQPQYAVVLSNWNANPKIEAVLFQFTPPKDAKKVNLLDLGKDKKP